MNDRAIWPWWGLVVAGTWLIAIGAAGENGSLDPRGTVHIPIGIANTLDSLKTFVEAEGIFSPGVGTYGVYFWVSYGTRDETKLCAPTMQGAECEYGLAEGGQSGSGGWGHLRTTWNGSVAMPHGWASAEVHLLLRDCLAYEDDQQLVLLAGVPERWFTESSGMSVKNLPTHFGRLSLAWKTGGDSATLRLENDAKPPQGFILSLPAALRAKVAVHGKPIERAERGFVLPPGTTQTEIRFY